MFRCNPKDRFEISRRTFLQILLDGKREMSAEEAELRAKRLGMLELQPPFVVVAVAPNYGAVPIEQRDDILHEYENYVCRLLDNYGYHGACLTDSYSRVLALLSLARLGEDSNELDEVFADVHRTLYMHFHCDLFIGIGGIVKALNQVGTSTADSIEMLAYKYQYASRGVINISNIKRFSSARYVGNTVAIDRVIGRFQDGDLGQMAVRLDELIDEIRHKPGVSDSSIRRTMAELIIKVLSIASNYGVDVDEILEHKDPYKWALSQTRTEVLVEGFMEMCSKMLVEMNENRKKNENLTLKQVVDYIDENLHRNDLSLLQVSAYAGLSSSYFSQMFKREMGQGMSAYITQSRIRRAKELLLSTDLKMEDIALQSGFSSVNYFSTVFKSSTGQSPAEFRRSVLS